MPEKINKVIDATVNEILKITDGITEQELNRAKVSYKSSVLMSLENSTARARVLGRQMQHFGKHIPFDESIGLISSVSLDDIKATAKRIFSSKITLTALGKCDGIYDMDVVKSKLLK